MIDINDRSVFVKEIQSWLYEISRDISEVSPVFPNGIYGPETTESVKNFQRVFGLFQSGNVDYETWTAIYAEYRRLSEIRGAASYLTPFDTELRGDRVSAGDISTLVQIIQIILVTLSGQYASFPSIEIDGEYGESTKRAVEIFQETNGLEVTGEVDKITWNRLADRFNEAIKYSD